MKLSTQMFKYLIRVFRFSGIRAETEHFFPPIEMLIMFHCLIIASNVHYFKLDKIIENAWILNYITLLIIIR